MKLLYIGRIFSGLESSVLSEEWAPTGVPTICKIIEGLDRTSHELEIILIDRGVSENFTRNWKQRQPKKIKLKGLNATVLVVPNGEEGNFLPGRFGAKFDEFKQIKTVYNFMKKFDPDLVYVDRSNVLAAAMSARHFSKPTLLRIMGIYPSMWEVLKGGSLMAKLERWAFRSPFASVICTQDGTGGEAWMNAALVSSTPRTMMLNGFQPAAKSKDNLPAELKALPDDKTIVMFVGRLEHIKGWREFVNGVLQVKPELRKKLHALVIGTGSGKTELESIVSKNGAEDMFTLIDRIPHLQMQTARKNAHIYVSLNKLGNLSNSNLECFADGMCVIMPNSDPDRGVDTATDKLIPEAAAIRIDRNDLEQQLAKALEKLLEHPEKISKIAANMKKAAKGVLQPWDDRVAGEIELLEALAADGAQ